MSMRSLSRRVKALAGDREPEEVVEALAALWKTGRAPADHAGQKAAELWEMAREKLGDETEDFMIYLWCSLRVTGRSLADLLHGAER